MTADTDFFFFFRSFARLFGVVAPVAVPPASFAFWLARDASSMWFFFAAPSLVTALVTSSKESGGGGGGGGGTARKENFFLGAAAAFATPVIAQLVTTPLHLAGLDAYNRPYNAGSRLLDSGGGVVTTLKQRLGFLRAQLPVVLPARALRIIPAYSCGGIVNASVRRAANGNPVLS